MTMRRGFTSRSACHLKSWADDPTRLALARNLYGDVLPDAAINYVWDNRYPVGHTKAECLYRACPDA